MVIQSTLLFIQNREVKTMKNIIKLLKVLFQLLIFLIIIDRMMSQCGIRWRGTCEFKKQLIRRKNTLM